MLLSAVLTGKSSATTWAPTKVVCPICKTTNTFYAIASYGTYIYRWPSKFQYIFWPYTDKHVLYSCKKCRLTCFMSDFRRIPEEKREAIRKSLEGVKLDKEYDSYTKIPMSQRLRIAERVYGAVVRDDAFWCRFYRILGYHLDREKRPKEAAGARKKALSFAEKMLKREELAGIRKELLLIRGAMRHFLKDNKGALADFRAAAKLKFENKKIGEKRSANVDRYLSALLKEYIERIEKGARDKAPGT